MRGRALVGATSIVALHARLSPDGSRWQVSCSPPPAFGEWALILFFPLPLLVLWVLVIGLALFRRSQPGLETPAPASHNP